MKSVVMFPGQGSQCSGMGNNLFEKYQSILEVANEITGFDIRDVCLNGSESLLSQTNITQVIIYVVNMLSYEEWKEDHSIPDFVLGHSIGQYNAMVAAEMISFEVGLKLVKERGKIMNQQSGGAMVAVMKISADDIESIISDNNYEKVSIANFNSEYQNVISMHESVTVQLTDLLKKHGAFLVPLKTSGAFHSPFMLPASNQFGNFLNKINFDKPICKLICNTTADNIKNVKKSLSNHLTQPVKWKQSIYRVLHHCHHDNVRFHECGEGSTLTNILRYNQKEFLSFFTQQS